MSSASVERPAWGPCKAHAWGQHFLPQAPGDSPQRSCAAPSHVSEGLAPLSQYLKAPGLRGRSLCQRGRGQLPRLSLQRSRCSARPIMDGHSSTLDLYPALVERRGGLGDAGVKLLARGRQLASSDRARGRDVDAPPHWPPWLPHRCPPLILCCEHRVPGAWPAALGCLHLESFEGLARLGPAPASAAGPTNCLSSEESMNELTSVALHPGTALRMSRAREK